MNTIEIIAPDRNLRTAANDRKIPSQDRAKIKNLKITCGFSTLAPYGLIRLSMTIRKIMENTRNFQVPIFSLNGSFAARYIIIAEIKISINILTSVKRIAKKIYVIRRNSFVLGSNLWTKLFLGKYLK